jgi:hypothetical protein
MMHTPVCLRFRRVRLLSDGAPCGRWQDGGGATARPRPSSQVGQQCRRSPASTADARPADTQQSTNSPGDQQSLRRQSSV